MHLVEGSKGANDVSVRCLICDRWLKVSEAMCDLDGPAFVAFYHRACISRGEVRPS